MQRTDRPSDRRLLIQFLEYMVGGGVYFWAGLGVFAVLYNVFHWSWLPAKVLADLVGWTLNFIIQRYWAFNDVRLKGRDWPVITRYSIIKVTDLLIDYTTVALFISAGLTPYFGFLVSAMFTTVWDYIWYRFWVFKPIANSS